MVINITASATFTDSEQISHNEQVTMLTQLGIINGYGDGSFKPKNNITRAEFAKMVYVTLHGTDDKGGIFASMPSKFNDVKNHWARGYINYAEQAGIIQGRNATRFDPDGKLTAFEAAKMGLLMLGYDAKREQLIGTNWQANVAKLAGDKSIFKNYTGNAASYTDRERAALILYNAIFAKTVIFSQATQSIHDEETTLGEKKLGLVLIEGIAVANERYALSQGVTPKKDYTVISREFGGNISVPTPVDDILLGQSVKVYVRAKSPIETGEPITSVNIGKVYGSIVTDAGKTKVYTVASADAEYKATPRPTLSFQNEKDKTISLSACTEEAMPYYQNYVKSKASLADTRTNEKVYFISNDGVDETIEYVFKISMEYTLVSYYNAKTQIVKLSSGEQYDFSKVSMPEPLKEGDRILKYSENDKTVLKKAPSFTGKLIGTSGNRANISGNFYEAGKLKGSLFQSDGLELTSGPSSIVSDSYFNKSMLYFTDGRFVLEVALPDSSKTPDNYVMVASSGTDNLWSGVVPRVRVVFADNQNEVYEVSSLDNLNMNDPNAVKRAFDNNAAVGLYRYILFNGKMQLYSADKLTSPGIYTPKNGVLDDAGNEYYTDENTIIYVRTQDSYRAYTSDQIKSPIHGISGTKAWGASELWGGKQLLKAFVITAEYLPPIESMEEPFAAYVLDHPESQFNLETEKWFLTLKVLINGEVRTISALDGVKESGSLGLGSYGNVFKGDFLLLTLTADTSKISYIEKPDYRANVLTDDPKDGVYAATIGEVFDQWLTLYPVDSQKLITLPANEAKYYTINGDKKGSGYIPEMSPAPAGQFNAIVVIKDEKVHEVFVNETGFWK